MIFIKLSKAIYYSTGVFVTTPIIALYIGEFSISLFTIFFGIFIGLLILKSELSVKINTYNNKFLALVFWFLWALIASILGLIYFNGEKDWASNILSYVPKIILFLVITLLISTFKNPKEIIDPFLKGLIVGFLLNILWSIGEGLSFYLFGFILNDEVFSRYASTLPIDRQTMTIMADGIIRVSGFNTDPAHLGGIIPIVIIYSLVKKKYVYIFLSLVSLAFSGSTTALLSSVFAILISYGKLDLLNLKKSVINMKSFSTLVISLIITSSLILTNGEFYQSIESNTQGFYKRTTTTYISDIEQGPRYIYHAYLPEAMSYSGIRTLTGSGFGIASYPYVVSPDIPKAEGMEYFPYDPESTYISYLFDVGLLGLIIYLFILTSSILHYRKNINFSNSYQIIYAALCGIIFSGFFYHYTLTAYQVLVLIFAVTLSSKKINIRE